MAVGERSAASADYLCAGDMSALVERRVEGLQVAFRAVGLSHIIEFVSPGKNKSFVGGVVK